MVRKTSNEQNSLVNFYPELKVRFLIPLSMETIKDIKRTQTHTHTHTHAHTHTHTHTHTHPHTHYYITVR